MQDTICRNCGGRFMPYKWVMNNFSEEIVAECIFCGSNATHEADDGYIPYPKKDKENKNVGVPECQ
jgi:hypothetical protein